MRGEGRKEGRGLNEQNGTKPYLNWEAFPNIGGEQNGNVVAGKLKSQERSELDSQTDRRSGFKFSLVGCFCPKLEQPSNPPYKQPWNL